MQAIRTRYYGPTNTRGSKIQAKCEARTIYVEYEDAENSDENHARACMVLRDRMGWNTDYYAKMCGGVFDRDWYWVFTY